MSVRNWLSGRDRLTACAIGVVVVALAVTAVAVGSGVAGFAPRLADIGAWLGNRNRGDVVHVNGVSGELDGRVPVSDRAGHPLLVVQDGDLAVYAGAGESYVVDARAGTVRRLDPDTLATAGPAMSLPAPLGPSAVDGQGTVARTGSR